MLSTKRNRRYLEGKARLDWDIAEDRSFQMQQQRKLSNLVVDN